MKSNLVRFDWAAKRLLRQKSNFVVLEGLLSTLLEEDIRIVRMLESEGNKEDFSDKFNRVDMLAENSKGELIIVEIQNNRELDYFHRMLYGVSKAITEYIREGEEYSQVKKLYSVNIVYFDLGQGEDYIYHGRTEFRGIHKHDVLKLSQRQQEQFTHRDAGDLFPEYYVLRIDEFNKKAVTPLDEWISFLKTGEIPENVKAKGLIEARERLQKDRLDKSERAAYDAHMESLRYQKSVIKTSLIEGTAKGRAEGRKEGRAEGRAEGRKEGEAIGLEKGEAIGLEKGKLEVVIASNKAGLPIETIADITGLTTDKVAEILKQHKQ
ncbi:MAG: Rpn family recombination-promoting nuclease/putative transposase [Dysgonamonadaceae bacterium]|jgi:predicted transposase/invertase (TIGR01784 family)|nr:Rpn family recombination-promoting nuclease/putative transposase [Dysgonamonadaceae bacterium]